MIAVLSLGLLTVTARARRIEAHRGTMLCAFAVSTLFLALYLLMSKLILPRINGILSQREDRIDGNLQRAEALKEDRLYRSAEQDPRRKSCRFAQRRR